MGDKNEDIYKIIYDIEDFEINPPICPPDLIDKLSTEDAYKLVIYIDQKMEDWNLTKRFNKYFKEEMKKYKNAPE